MAKSGKLFGPKANIISQLGLNNEALETNQIWMKSTVDPN